MNRIYMLLVAMAMILGLSAKAHSTLINRGTDSLGNRLIYDTVLNITWYDYTHLHVYDDSWQDHMNWASNLTTNFNGIIYDDWRLPSTVNGIPQGGYDGTTTAGYNIASSEMGHLFYTGLGNTGYYDTSGNPQSGWGLTNTGEFEHLFPYEYWSSTESPWFDPWHFSMGSGHQGVGDEALPFSALAVRPGDVATVPEPSTLLLLGGGFLSLAAMRKKFRK